MGQALSKHPVREVVGGSAVIAALCWWLEKEVNLPHNPHLRPKPKIRAADKDALPVEGKAMGRSKLSFASLQRLARGGRRLLEAREDGRADARGRDVDGLGHVHGGQQRLDGPRRPDARALAEELVRGQRRGLARRAGWHPRGGERPRSRARPANSRPTPSSSRGEK